MDGRNYRPKHVELIVIINKIIIFTSSWLFILFYLNFFKNFVYFLGNALKILEFNQLGTLFPHSHMSAPWGFIVDQ